MTTTLEIITQALRETNLIAIGQTPTSAQRTEGLGRLNGLVSSVLGYEVGEKLEDWPVGVDNINIYDQPYCWNSIIWARPLVNKRLVCNVQSAQTIYLPPDPCDGSRMAALDLSMDWSTNNLTLDGNGRLIEGGGTLVLDEQGVGGPWMYRADLGDWVLVEGLVIDSEMPYPTEYDDAFITMLAMRMNPRYGRTTSPETISTLERAVSQLRARYRQTIVTAADPGVLAMSVQAYNSQYYPWGARGRFGWMM